MTRKDRSKQKNIISPILQKMHGELLKNRIKNHSRLRTLDS